MNQSEADVGVVGGAGHVGDELAPKLTAKGFKGRDIAPSPAPRIL